MKFRKIDLRIWRCNGSDTKFLIYAGQPELKAFVKKCGFYDSMSISGWGRVIYLECGRPSGVSLNDGFLWALRRSQQTNKTWKP